MRNSIVRAYSRLNTLLWLQLSSQNTKRREIGSGSLSKVPISKNEEEMKTYNGLWEQLITKENFELAYKNSIKRKRSQWQIKLFQDRC